MMSFAPQWIFLILGPLFLALGVMRWATARRLVPQAKAWLLVGAIFCLVAAWLWLVVPLAA